MVTTIDLMEFVHELRADFFECAAKLGWAEFTKDRGVSMLSFRDVFLHLAYVEEQHVTQFCEGRPTPWMPEVMKIPQDRYRSLPEVRRRLREVRAMGDRRFKKWNSSEGLATPAVWVAARKYPLRLSRDSALAQCVTEHLLHLGEVEAMLWQMDVEPPTTFWIERRVLHGRWPPPRSALVGGRVLRDPTSARRARPAARRRGAAAGTSRPGSPPRRAPAARYARRRRPQPR